MNLGRLATAVIAIFLASGLAKFGNENYEALKEQGGVIIPILCLLGALVLGIYGVVAFFRAFVSK